VARLEESQGIFQNFAELADLRRAHGSFFARRLEVIIDALLQIPFEQLHALLHADLFAAPPARLVQFLYLDNPRHTSG